MLSSIAGAIVTTTSLTFSLTVVAFQLASSHASPRLLRTFARTLAVAVTEIRRYGSGDLDTATALFGLLRVTATDARASIHEAVRTELGLLVGSVARADYAPVERERFGALAAGVDEELRSACRPASGTGRAPRG